MTEDWFKVEYDGKSQYGLIEGNPLTLVGIKHDRRGWWKRRKGTPTKVKEWIFAVSIGGEPQIVYTWQKLGKIAIKMGYSLRKDSSPYAIPMEFYVRAFRSSVDHFKAETWWKNLGTIRTLNAMGLNRYSEWRKLNNYVLMRNVGLPVAQEHGKIVNGDYYKVPSRKGKRDRNKYYKNRYANPRFYDYEKGGSYKGKG